MTRPTSKQPNLTKGTKAFVDALEAKNAPPLYTLTPVEARKVLNDAQSGVTAKPDAEVRDIQVKGGPTGSVEVRVVRPKQARDALPCILYLHGGGWVMGNADTHDRLIRELAVGAEATVVFVNYTPSPEAKFPVPCEQAWTVLQDITAHPDTYGVDRNRIALVGDSVGGNMAVALAICAKERHGPKLVFQLLFYPVTNAEFDTDSYSDFADGPWLTKKAMEWFWDQYLPDKDKRKNMLASPLQAPEDVLRGLPPALIITAENDVLRDEGEALARKFDEAGVDSACIRVKGTIHDFVMLNALAATAPARVAMTAAIAVLKGRLAQGVR